MNEETQPAQPTPAPDPASVEHAILLRHLAAVQKRCSELLTQQAQEIARLRGQTMQLRAQIIARDSALAWAQADRAALETAAPDLAPRVRLARKVKELHARLQDLMREKLQMPISASPPSTAEPDLSELEAGIVAADLVICQTGCLSHGAYWRVQDHCKRTGKTCVLVEQPEHYRVVRIHQVHEALQLDSDG